jgi:uncharacterized protein (TIGR00288 family)
MNIPYIRAPHAEGASPSGSPNAALLIDFDNVTMGMRSDLSKELKNLLKSDVIRGKVTVQRAYADWRRYPQYIVPLSEASVDLIFAPAYGSSKKNATDIRMAIDGMELVFTRPEIGTYILLTGDSDFSSLVLKLKEYGKYVIGVGIQESSSDILVQNCDEYYSYTSLTGLRKAGSGEQRSQQDPWSLAERAVEQMTKRRDVMRSDRLKQVMLDLDSTFDEKAVGFSKFSRFLTEAAQKGILHLRKLENGQYEVAPGRGSSTSAAASAAEAGDAKAPARREREGRDGREGRSGRGGRDRGREPSRRDEAAAEAAPDAPETTPTPEPTGTPVPTPPVEALPSGDAAEVAADPARLRVAYELLVRAIEDLAEGDGAVRDSDVKRRMLAIESDFDEAELGFSKFSRFLKQGHDHGVVELSRDENGIYELKVRGGAGAFDGAEASTAAPGRSAPGRTEAPRESKAAAPSATVETSDGRRLRPRLSSRRRGGGSDEPPPFLEGQAVAAPSETGGGRGRPAERPVARDEGEERAPQVAAVKAAPAPGGSDLDDLGLPNGADSMAQYLMNSYKGVGKKTAETLLEAHGDRLFHVMETDPDQIRRLLPAARAETLLEQWIDDVARRRAEVHGPAGRVAPKKESSGGGGRRPRGSGGGRRRGGSGGGRSRG